MKTEIYRGREITEMPNGFIAYGKIFKTRTQAMQFIDSVKAKFNSFCNKFNLPK